MISANPLLQRLRIEIFADGADREGMLEMYRNPLISGFTTNPALLRRAGVNDCHAFAREMVTCIPDRPIFFEVVSDEFEEMRTEALEIASWGPNVHVKVPVTNSRGESSCELLGELVAAGVRLNVTALMTMRQVMMVSERLAAAPAGYLSVFAGRIADTGRDPVPIMSEIVQCLRPLPGLRLIWASSREVLNIFQADASGCHVITMTHDLLRRLHRVGADLEEMSVEMIRAFHHDALAAGLELCAQPTARDAVHAAGRAPAQAPGPVGQ